ncbi:MAG: bifunctional hydroxymethylpyrimidine kinase/phosphomethylpyrimidine kinase [Firmicutes bacterium]|nr:bifunctional hydroxymethylpyrimidine kinase/phosphomethylpyrimidine kinase [Bacillota bacterium]
MKLARSLTIAGSDSGGGAGIQADLKTFTVLDTFGMSVVTAVTAQNTLGVQGVWPLPLEAVAQQIDAVVTDIGVDAVKTGMLADNEVIQLVAAKVREHHLPHLVVDPVMVAKGGQRLLAAGAQVALRQHLLPLAEVVTPNLPEAEVLTGRPVRCEADMLDAARRILADGARAVVLKGGHLDGPARDLFYDGSGFDWLEAPRISTPHTHGTGCTFSAAICAGLARGTALRAAVAQAKELITVAIANAPGLGHGHGPTNVMAYRPHRVATPREDA